MDDKNNNIDQNQEKMDGYILIDKEVGITSYDAIRKLKKILPHKQKIGHAGTLDPFASGLLITMLGKATKTWNQLQQLPKTYEVKVEFGYETDTQDPTGKVIREVPAGTGLSGESLRQAMLKFTGNISQTPPSYSAKKVNGKRAYDLARSGEIFDLAPKQVEIYEFNITKMKWPKVEFEVTVSSGTYIRTLIVDLAREIGMAATATDLRRTAIGNFKVDDALKSSDINEKTKIEDYLIKL